MRILGIDPGYDRLGVAILDKKGGTKELLLHSACLTSERTSIFSDRIKGLGLALSLVITQWKPEVIAIEKLFFTKNQKTAMGVAEMRGVITYIGATSGLIVTEYTPGEVKTAVTGYGKAEKRDVQRMIERLIELPSRTRHDDEYDAIAVALTCAATYKGGTKYQIPGTK